MALRNHDIVQMFRDIALYLEMQGVAFKPRAYEKVARVIEDMSEELADLYKKGGRTALEAVPGVGVSIAEKIEELLLKGTSSYYEELKKKTPVDLESLSCIEGLGPKGILKLYEHLKIKNLEELECAAKNRKIRIIPGFGEKTEENILKGIAFVKKTGDTFLLSSVMPIVHEIEARLSRVKGVEKCVVVGSVRRKKEMVGDIDMLVISRSPKEVMDVFVSMPEVAHVYAHGETKSAVKLKEGIDVDLRVVEGKSYGAALNYFTGSKGHNAALREIALKKGMELNEYGLFSGQGEQGKGEKQIAGGTEEEVYNALGMDYIEPELREETGEINCAISHTLPQLIGYDDLRGDLQVHSTWSDGANSIEEMAEAAHAMGLEYLLATDHSKRLAMTHGLDEKKIKVQWKEIEKVNSKFEAQNLKFKVLKGTECDILKDGSLDFSDEVLSKLDVVGVSAHSYFNLSKEEQTRRIVRAMRNPHVDILFHPTGRILQKRDAYPVDMDEVIRTAKETGTVLEIDATLNRLDLHDEHVRKCVEKRVKLSIGSDSHATSQFPCLMYGIAQARRGWATKNDIINVWPLEKMLGMLKKE